MHFLVVQMEKCMYIEAMYKYVNLNSEQLTSTFLLHAEFSAMDYTLNIVSKCLFFFIFKHSRALSRSWKIIHGGPGNVMDFFCQ